MLCALSELPQGEWAGRDSLLWDMICHPREFSKRDLSPESHQGSIENCG